MGDIISDILTIYPYEPGSILLDDSADSVYSYQTQHNAAS